LIRLANKTLIRITTIPVSLYTLLGGQLNFMKNHYHVIGISSSGKLLQRVAEKEGVKVQAVEMTRRISPWKDLKAVWTLYKIFKKEKPLIVHTHTPKAGTVGMLAAKLARVPLRLHTIAGLPLLESKGEKRKLLNAVEKVTYACATNIYPNSFKLKEIILQNQFCKENKLKVIADGSTNGINTSHFSTLHFTVEKKHSLKHQLQIKEEDFVFVFVGRLVSDKGINELIGAFAKLYNETNKVKLLLVGAEEPDHDPLKEDTLNIIKTHAGIITAGYQPDVRIYFQISDALVFPSYREGFPNVVMQAGAMELPAIVTDINGCNEIVINGQNGILVPPKDIHKLYGAMKMLMEDVLLYNNLKQNARSMITSRYEQNRFWNEILKEYKRLENNLK